jgi:hypothetical protein
MIAIGYDLRDQIKNIIFRMKDTLLIFHGYENFIEIESEKLYNQLFLDFLDRKNQHFDGYISIK